MQTLEGVVRDRLAALNSDLVGHPLRAYRLTWDDDFEDYAVWALYGLPEPAGDTWPLDLTDPLCERANDCLEGLVTFVFCDFRTAAEAAEAIEAEKVLGWRELTTDAAPAV